MSIETFGNGGILITGKDDIELARLLAIKGRLKLELHGIRFRGGSTFAYVKKMWSLRGSREAVYAAFCAMHGFEA